MSFLPLAHSLEQCLNGKMITCGGRIGYFSGDVTKLLDDVQVLQPTFFVGVPRLLNKIYSSINQRIDSAGGAKATLFRNAMAAKLENLRTSDAYTHMIYDSLVFGKIKALVGGRVRFMVTGSAPISVEVMEFLKCAFCCPILEGYG